MNRDIIFKGATRPPMMLGVPIVPFISLACVDLIVATWSFILGGMLVCLAVLLFGGACVLALRFISSQDDHRLNQHVMRLRSIGFRRNAKHWNAHSMSPNDFMKRG